MEIMSKIITGGSTMRGAVTGHSNKELGVANARPSALDLWKRAGLKTSRTMENSNP